MPEPLKHSDSMCDGSFYGRHGALFTASISTRSQRRCTTRGSIEQWAGKAGAWSIPRRFSAAPAMCNAGRETICTLHKERWHVRRALSRDVVRRHSTETRTGLLLTFLPPISIRPKAMTVPPSGETRGSSGSRDIRQFARVSWLQAVVTCSAQTGLRLSGWEACQSPLAVRIIRCRPRFSAL